MADKDSETPVDEFPPPMSDEDKIKAGVEPEFHGLPVKGPVLKIVKKGRKPGKNSKVTRADRMGGEVSLKSDPSWAVAERDDPAYKKFSEYVGGRDGLAELAAWSDNPKAKNLLSLLDDPKFKNYGIKSLANRCGMTLPELCNLFREKKFLEMYLNFFSGVPDIAAGAVQDALPSFDVCPLCVGDKTIERNKTILPCPKCGATGQIRIAGDKEARRDVFKAVGIHKDSGTNITQIGNVTVEGVDDFESLMKSAKTVPIQVKDNGKEKEVVEAEVIQGDPEG